MSVALNQITDFVKEELKLIDGATLKQSDMDTLFIAVNSATKQTPLVPANALTRFQFMEFFLRVASKKFVESMILLTFLDKVSDNEVQAIYKMNNEIILPYFKRLTNSHQWRLSRYWNEQCDNFYKAHMDLFQHLYLRYGGTHKLPGQNLYTSLSPVAL